MNGRELYRLYVEANRESNVAVDYWEDLSADDQEIWDRMAAKAHRAIIGEQS
jgi:hypothetical protein